MKFSLLRETLLKPLQAVVGVIERRQTLPILANVLLKVSVHGQQATLALLGTDLEVELTTAIALDPSTTLAGTTTVSARKLMDICRTLPEQTLIQFALEEEKLIIKAGRSRFMLATLPAAEFPHIAEGQASAEITLLKKDLRHLIQRTAFAIAENDVRYFLNGLLIAIEGKHIRTVATDGHRLALNTIAAEHPLGDLQIIVPRKGILEILRLLDDTTEEIALTIGENHLRIATANTIFYSKLIEGRFPDYTKVLPKAADKVITLDTPTFKQALARVAVLCDDKHRGIKLHLCPNLLRIAINNPEHEEAEEELPIDYQGEALEIAFNVNYLLDVLTVVTGPIKMSLSTPNNSALIEEVENSGGLYVVMPMLL